MNTLRFDNKELAILYVALRTLHEKWAGDEQYDTIYARVEKAYDNRTQGQEPTELYDQGTPTNAYPVPRMDVDDDDLHDIDEDDYTRRGEDR